MCGDFLFFFNALVIHGKMRTNLLTICYIVKYFITLFNFFFLSCEMLYQNKKLEIIISRYIASLWTIVLK